MTENTIPGDSELAVIVGFLSSRMAAVAAPAASPAELASVLHALQRLVEFHHVAPGLRAAERIGWAVTRLVSDRLRSEMDIFVGTRRPPPPRGALH